MRCRSHIKTLLEEFVLGPGGAHFSRASGGVLAVSLLLVIFPFVLFGHSDYFDFGFTTLSQSKCTFTEQVMKIPQHLSLEPRKISRTQWTLSGFFKAGCDV